MTQFIIDSAIFQKFPGLYIGLLVARGVDNAGHAEEITPRLREAEKYVREGLDVETLSEQSKIAVWREAYRSFGAKPKEHRSSIENLCRLVLNGVELRHINKLVDIYNYISLKHMFPVGGEDLDKTEGDIHLTFASANEPEVLLLGDKDPRPPHEGEVIYRDDISAICRRWNWREADRTKLNEDTKNCILAIEGLSPVTQVEEIEAATQELRQLVEKYCGGTITDHVLNSDRPVVEI